MEPRSWPPSIPSDDRGFLLGDALFETIPVHAGRPFRLERHLARLRDGARAVGIVVPDDLEERIGDALSATAGGTGGLRITLSRGSGGGLHPAAAAVPRVVIGLRGMPSPWPRPGLSAALYGRIAEQALTAGLKGAMYLERIQALRRAHAEGCHEALLRNSRDQVVEGSASNLFAVVGPCLVAPGSPEGALPGVTREAVIEIARASGLPVEERGLTVEEVEHASEVMLSSALRGLVPVVRVGGSPVGEGRPGPTFERLADELARLVARETGGPETDGLPDQPSP
jgi:branched-subunit amino acid aminotransferase/4-amino-4-deoxychorismate lyase